MRITRVWAMPSSNTFTIKPIAELLKRWNVGKGWVDPFAGDHSPAEITNDLNPSKRSLFHLDALEFVQQLTGEFEGALYDPPYSPRQIRECYAGIGRHMSFKDGEGFSKVKRMLAGKLRVGGLLICCGWNSNGVGKKYGFRMEEILLVAHGRGHNDTIVTVERKVYHQERLWGWTESE